MISERHIGYTMLFLVGSFFIGAAMQPKTDNCALNETQIRRLWVAAIIPARGDDTARARIAAELVKASEEQCRELRDAKPSPLPANLQNLIK